VIKQTLLEKINEEKPEFGSLVKKIFETKEFDKDSVHGYYAKTKAEAAKNVLEAVKNRNLKF